jgi:hypothetical protein
MMNFNLIRNEIPIVLDCHITEKLEAIAQCKEMPIILANKVVDKKIKIGIRRAEGERHSGLRVAAPSRI